MAVKAVRVDQEDATAGMAAATRGVLAVAADMRGVAAVAPVMRGARTAIRAGPAARAIISPGMAMTFAAAIPPPPRFRGDDYRVYDWHARGLQAPPPGEHWAYIDGNYVLIAAATGIITSIIMSTMLPH